jgi:MoxR-like ATPase
MNRQKEKAIKSSQRTQHMGSVADMLEQITAEIGGKVVHLSQPYNARIPPLVGREAELALLTAAWITSRGSLPLSPLLLGEPGVGKNRLIYEVAGRTAKNLYIFQGHEDVTAEDLACAVRFSDDPGKKMDYVASPLVTAMHTGGICFIDEIAKIRPRALALLISVLDERRYIDSILLGTRVMAHEGFRFVAATNTADMQSNILPEFLRSRMRPIIEVGYSSAEEIAKIVQTRFPNLQDSTKPLLNRFWELWHSQVSDGHESKPPTPRDIIHLFDLALSHADFEALGGRPRLYASGYESPMELTVDQRGHVTPEHLEIAFRELFRAEAQVKP